KTPFGSPEWQVADRLLAPVLAAVFPSGRHSSTFRQLQSLFGLTLSRTIGSDAQTLLMAMSVQDDRLVLYCNVQLKNGSSRAKAMSKASSAPPALALPRKPFCMALAFDHTAMPLSESVTQILAPRVDTKHRANIADGYEADEDKAGDPAADAPAA